MSLPSDSQFQVIIPDPWSSLRGYETNPVESTHSTLAAAEARCQEIVVHELRSRHEQEMTWTEALRDYLQHGSLPHTLCPEGHHMFFSNFARNWVAAELASDWPGLMKRIAETKPEIPRGWFRWLHHSYLSRMPAAVHLDLEMEWESLELIVLADASRLDALLKLHVEAHAWEIGQHGLHTLAESCWDQLSPVARGRMLAGMAEIEILRSPGGIVLEQCSVTSRSNSRSSGPPSAPWILARMHEASLLAESVLEIACCAVWQRNEPMLKEVIYHGKLRLRDTVERMEPFMKDCWSREGYHATGVARLSSRVIDMVLEASVLRSWKPGVSLALASGANPNLRIWALERNSNEDFTALSFAMAGEGSDLVDLLLDAGADTASEGSSKCLYLAITKGNDALADRLIAAGLSFDQGDKPEWLAQSAPGDKIEWENSMSFNCHREDIERAERMSQGLPLVHASETAWFYSGDGQGGRYRTILSHFLYHDDVRRLQHFVSQGMPLRISLPDLSTALNWGAYHCLSWILKQWGAPLAYMLRLRRELPDFGTGRRLWMVQPDSRRIGLLPKFEPGDQTPLELPDGGKLWVDLNAIAGPNHGLGPVTEGAFWVRRTTVTPRRRADCIVLRGVSQGWELKSVPANDYQLRDLLPLIKEVDGVFLHTGLTMGKVWWQDYPCGGPEKQWIKQWAEGEAWAKIRPQVIDRCSAQRAANINGPSPTLSKEELEGYPHEFHCWLCRTEGGSIDLDEKAARKYPQVIKHYRTWAETNRRREREFVPDARFEQWPMWEKVPADLRPWFVWNELFSKPTVIHLRHPSDYEKAMIHKAVLWNNDQFILAVRGVNEAGKPSK